MPGLFGFVSLDPRRPLSREYAWSIMNTMLHALSCHAEYRLDTFVSETCGLGIARLCQS
jgi:hypothetical protein